MEISIVHGHPQLISPINLLASSEVDPPYRSHVCSPGLLAAQAVLTHSNTMPPLLHFVTAPPRSSAVSSSLLLFLGRRSFFALRLQLPLCLEFYSFTLLGFCSPLLPYYAHFPVGVPAVIRNFLQTSSTLLLWLHYQFWYL